MTLYRKQGRKYIPVAEYGDEWALSYQHGTHLVFSRPGFKQTVRVDARSFDPLQVATLIQAADVIAFKLKEMDTLEPAHKMTQEQFNAWRKFLSTMPKSFKTNPCLIKPALRETVRKALEGMAKETP